MKTKNGVTIFEIFLKIQSYKLTEQRYVTFPNKME